MADEWRRVSDRAPHQPRENNCFRRATDARASGPQTVLPNTDRQSREFFLQGIAVVFDVMYNQPRGGVTTGGGEAARRRPVAEGGAQRGAKLTFLPGV